MTAFSNSTHIRNLALLLLAATTFLASPTVVWGAGGTRLEERLSGNTAASGKAKFEARNVRRKFSAEVERAGRNLPLQILVRRGTQTWLVANTQTNNFGFVDVNRDTANGQLVPVLAAGDIVEVRTGSGILLQGILQPR